MAVIYAEDWSPGASLFETVYRYNRTGVSSEAQDPLYPFMWVAEGVYINPDGRLDKDPAYTGPFETYQNAGIWVRDMGSELGGGGPYAAESGFWNGQQGCIQATYYPTEESLGPDPVVRNYCPVVCIASPDGFRMLAVNVDLENSTIDVFHDNEGSHDSEANVPGAPMPVAGEPYNVRVSWQCGTPDYDELTVLEDGFVRVYVNNELVYEVVDISLIFEWITVPMNMIKSAQFGFDGLLGPLDSFTITDTVCSTTSPIVFKSGRTSSPLAFSKILLKVVE